MPKTLPHVANRIREAREKHLATLDLSYTALLHIPEEVYELDHLEVLDLQGNHLKVIPDAITQLPHLRQIDLRYNQLLEAVPDVPGLVLDFDRYEQLQRSLSKKHITGVRCRTDFQISAARSFESLLVLDISNNWLKKLPEWIVELQNLTTLNVSANRLKTLPEWIIELQNLTTLDINANRLETLPECIGQLQNLTAFIAWGNSLGTLPEWIVELQNLTTLNVSANRLKTLPEWIIELQNLTSLSISSNWAKNLPTWLAKLQNLTSLNISHYQAKTLPEWITQLSNLTSLYIGGNHLETLPEWIAELQNLTALYLWENMLIELPIGIAKLQNLTSLDVSRNNLVSLPKWIGQLQNLTSLNVSRNKLKTLPTGTAKLQNLTSLDVSSNRLETLPECIGQLQSLISLNVNENLIQIPPPEVIEGGTDAIRAYFRQLEIEGEDKLYEAKFLIVGEPGAGKTSLAKKIINPAYELDAEEESTEGIDVSTWTFEMENGQSFRVNIWDFGGQEIYKDTHQFFLTKRSLYALLADTRKEDTDFYYWLNAVELLAENSPLLIIQNKKQDRQRPINMRQLQGQFSNLKEKLATNLATDYVLTDILAYIKHYISTLPHVGTPLPKTWVKVREVLENDARNHIRLDQYLDICKANSFTKREDALQLSDYLHDLGVCLHFQDDPLLKKTVILKPEWGTAAVYTVLDNKTVRDHFGRFTREDLETIWHEAHYAGMRDELLQLMLNFKLCYEIPGNAGTYIAPQLLTENQPDYDWDTDHNLLLRYTYEFMPKGLLTRLIVALHPLIEDQSLVWKTGVILTKSRTRAEVIEYYGKREIRIRVTGINKRDLMTIVAHELEKIHDSYHRLKYQKLIPCNCEKCATLAEPHFYPYEILQKFKEDRRNEIQCHKSYEMVNVRGLLDDVIDKTQYAPNESDIPHEAQRHKSPAAEAAPPVKPTPKVFLSYAWGGESEQIADELDAAFEKRNIDIVRDKRDLGFKGRIKGFMEQIGKGRCVVAIISKKYLESQNCMFELVQIAENDAFYDRIFPIVLDDAQLYKPKDRIQYVRHWEHEIKEFEDELRTVSPAYMEGFRDEIDLYNEIRRHLPRLAYILKDMNTLTSDIHRDSGFDELISAVANRLEEYA